MANSGYITIQQFIQYNILYLYIKKNYANQFIAPKNKGGSYMKEKKETKEYVDNDRFKDIDLEEQLIIGGGNAIITGLFNLWDSIFIKK